MSYTHAYGHNYSILLNDSFVLRDWNINELINQHKLKELITLISGNQNSLKIKRHQATSVSEKSGPISINLATLLNRIDQRYSNSVQIPQAREGKGDSSKGVHDFVPFHFFHHIKMMNYHKDHKEGKATYHQADYDSNEVQTRQEHLHNNLINNGNKTKRSHGYVSKMDQLHETLSLEGYESQAHHPLIPTSAVSTSKFIPYSREELKSPSKLNSLNQSPYLHKIHTPQETTTLKSIRNTNEVKVMTEDKVIDVFTEVAKPPPPPPSLSPIIFENRQKASVTPLKKKPNDKTLGRKDKLPFLTGLLGRVDSLKEVRTTPANTMSIHILSEKGEKKEAIHLPSVISQLHKELIIYHQNREKKSSIPPEIKNTTTNGENGGSLASPKNLNKNSKINQQKTYFVRSPHQSPVKGSDKRKPGSTARDKNRPSVSHESLLKELVSSRLYKHQANILKETSIETSYFPQCNKDTVERDKDTLIVNPFTKEKHELLVKPQLFTTLPTNISSQKQEGPYYPDKRRVSGALPPLVIEAISSTPQNKGDKLMTTELTKEQELITDLIDTHQTRDKGNDKGLTESQYGGNPHVCVTPSLRPSSRPFASERFDEKEAGWKGSMLGVYERMNSLLEMNSLLDINDVLKNQENYSSTNDDEWELGESDSLQTMNDDVHPLDPPIDQGSFVRKPIKRLALNRNLSLTQATLEFAKCLPTLQQAEKEAKTRKAKFVTRLLPAGMAVKVNQLDLNDSPSTFAEPIKSPTFTSSLPGVELESEPSKSDSSASSLLLMSPPPIQALTLTKSGDVHKDEKSLMEFSPPPPPPVPLSLSSKRKDLDLHHSTESPSLSPAPPPPMVMSLNHNSQAKDNTTAMDDFIKNGGMSKALKRLTKACYGDGDSDEEGEYDDY